MQRCDDRAAPARPLDDRLPGWTRRIAASTWLLLLSVALFACGPGEDSNEALVERGRQVFVLCATCHQVDNPANRAGPTLQGMIGRPAASQPSFAYSEALRRSAIVWDEGTLAAFLADPRGVVPGNRMAFAGLRDPDDIEAVIAYLRHATAAP